MMAGSHVIDYRIVGDDMQLVEITLDPGETVIAEAGSDVGDVRQIARLPQTPS